MIQALGGRKAELKNMMPSAIGTIRLEFLIASRALIGFRSELMVMTRGTGMMYQNFHEYQKFKGLKKENLRDHMNDFELIFSMLGERVSTEITRLLFLI